MRTYIYFVRHGESLSNLDPQWSGTHDTLSDTGIAQAQNVASYFKHIKVNRIFHSGILRAEQTSVEIEKVTGIKSEILGFLKEHGGSEEFETLKKRCFETKDFLENLSEKHIVIISHAIFLKSLAAYLILGDSLTENISQRFDNTLVLENTGVSKFMFNKEKAKWRMMSWNDLAHLAE